MFKSFMSVQLLSILQEKNIYFHRRFSCMHSSGKDIRLAKY